MHMGISAVLTRAVSRPTPSILQRHEAAGATGRLGHNHTLGWSDERAPPPLVLGAAPPLVRLMPRTFLMLSNDGLDIGR